MIEPFLLREIACWALAEDLPFGDQTGEALFPGPVPTRGIVLAKEPLVIAGLQIAETVFSEVDPRLNLEALRSEGTRANPGEEIARIQGDARGILRGERVALNFLQHLSGIATLTARFVEAVSGLAVQIADTRKTLPGLRRLEKEAVRLGGGKNHRMHLGDMILIKDNHVALAGGVGPALAAAKRSAPHSIKIEIELRNLGEIEEALAAGAQMVLLDNMDLKTLSEAVALIRRKAPKIKIEASGGVRLQNVREIAETGVDLISIGALTHSAPAADISLELLPSP